MVRIFYRAKGLNRMRKTCFLALLAVLGAAGAERRSSFDENWKFLKGDASAAEQPAFDDKAWRTLDLPHDWAIEGPFDVKFGPSTGGLPISRSEEHTSELQSLTHLACRLLLEKRKKTPGAAQLLRLTDRTRPPCRNTATT